MRVLHLISGGDTGGAKTHVITLLQELKQKIDIELVCLSEGVFFEEAKKSGIKAKLFEQKSRLDYTSIRELVQYLQSQNFDLLHCHGARANFVSNYIRKRVDIPIVTTIHSDYRLDFENQLYKKIIFTYLNRISLKKMDFFLTVTDTFKKMMSSEGFSEDRMYTIYNGVKPQHWIKSYSKQTSATLTFGCATRLVPIKGTDVLLEAANICKEEGYSFKILIAGHGEKKYTERLHSYVEEHELKTHVEFLGFVKDMQSFYEKIDVNILPSYTESFPYALLEGGERAIATIASRAGGIVEMIEDGVTGKLFDVGDAKTLATIMMDMINRQYDLEKLGLQFREKIHQSFSDAAMANRHVEIYTNILERVHKNPLNKEA